MRRVFHRLLAFYFILALGLGLAQPVRGQAGLSLTLTL